MVQKDARLEEKRMERVYALTDFIVEKLVSKGFKIKEQQAEAISEAIVNNRKDSISALTKVKKYTE